LNFICFDSPGSSSTFSNFLSCLTGGEIEAGESKQIRFSITYNDLKFISQENKWIVEHGYFAIKVGDKINQFYIYN